MKTIRYMYSVEYVSIDGRVVHGTSRSLAAVARWRKTPEGQSAAAVVYRRISLAHYNEAYRSRRGEVGGGWDWPTLRLCSEEFTPPFA